MLLRNNFCENCLAAPLYLFDGTENRPVVSDNTDPSLWRQVRQHGWAPKTSTAHRGIQINRVKSTPHLLKIETVSISERQSFG